MSLKIIKAGMLDTVQDLGRSGYRHLGINPTGAMDRFSAQLCNALLGKALNDPVIEMHFPAASYLFEESTIACLCGGNFSPMVNQQSLSVNQPFFIKAGCMLQFTKLQPGARCYLAVLPGLQIPLWLNSGSTNIKAGAGGWQGRALQKNDQLPFVKTIDVDSLFADHDVKHLAWKAADMMLNNHIACIKGKEWDWLTEDAAKNFLETPFTIQTNSDRMGYRLHGIWLLTKYSKELISTAVDFGTIQLLPNGQLIILMADHQTTGGYPAIAHVTSASLPALAQLNPNEKIWFNFISVKQAEEDLIKNQDYLKQLRVTCKMNIEKIIR